MLLRSHASKALRCLLAAGCSRAGAAGVSSAAEKAAGAATAPAAALLRQLHSASAEAAAGAAAGQPSSKKGGLSDDAPAAVDPETALAFSVPLDRQTRDTVEEVTM